MSTDSYGLRPHPAGQDSETSSCVAPKKQAYYTAKPRPFSGKEMCSNTDDMLAPLGFEPEGSATKPHFSENNSSLPEYISERNGYALFKQYLGEQKQESLLDFWFSCEEFRQLARNGSSLSISKANSTYNNYLLQSKLCCARVLHSGIRAKIKHQLGSTQPLSDTLFDHAQENILRYMNEHHYEKFLVSDIYMQSSISKDLRQKDCFSHLESSCLPPLPEENVFEQNPNNWKNLDASITTLGRCNREGYVPINLKLTKAALAGISQLPAPPVVSANHSDVQSLSSDAITDDTKSTVTDFSDMTAKSNEKQPGFQDVTDFVPRTKRVSKASKQLPPQEFAELLIEKLKKVEIERAQEERAAVNLAGLPHEYSRGNKKSILEDAAERHQQYQKFGRFGMGLSIPKYTEPCYRIPATNSLPHYSGYLEQQGIAGYYPPVDNCHSTNTSWQAPENMGKNCSHRGKKHWESVGTIESVPDSGVNVEEDFSLPPETRNRIHQWMEHNEKEIPHMCQPGYNKFRTPPMGGVVHAAQVSGKPLIPSPCQPESHNTIEEVSRLNPKDSREKRSRSQKNRSGYPSNKSSHAIRQQFPGDMNDCSSSMVSSEFRGMYRSSSVLSSVPSTVNSKDSGVGREEGTKIVYFLDGEKYPYQSILPNRTVYLRQFKELIAFKKGNYRYFFKTATEEEDCGAIYEEIRDNDAVLPCYGNKIICKVKEAKHV